MFDLTSSFNTNHAIAGHHDRIEYCHDQKRIRKGEPKVIIRQKMLLTEIVDPGRKSGGIIIDFSLE